MLRIQIIMLVELDLKLKANLKKKKITTEISIILYKSKKK